MGNENCSSTFTFLPVVVDVGLLLYLKVGIPFPNAIKRQRARFDEWIHVCRRSHWGKPGKAEICTVTQGRIGTNIKQTQLRLVTRPKDDFLPSSGIHLFDLWLEGFSDIWSRHGRYVLRTPNRMCPRNPHIHILTGVCRCQMGGLVVYRGKPAPKYVWEMLLVDTGELFLHFDVRIPERNIGILSLINICALCLRQTPPLFGSDD